jgi:hypothetical protein
MKGPIPPFPDVARSNYHTKYSGVIIISYRKRKINAILLAYHKIRCTYNNN